MEVNLAGKGKIGVTKGSQYVRKKSGEGLSRRVLDVIEGFLFRTLWDGVVCGYIAVLAVTLKI